MEYGETVYGNLTSADSESVQLRAMSELTRSRRRKVLSKGVRRSPRRGDEKAHHVRMELTSLVLAEKLDDAGIPFRAGNLQRRAGHVPRRSTLVRAPP
jgi:hypothetical protein